MIGNAFGLVEFLTDRWGAGGAGQDTGVRDSGSQEGAPLQNVKDAGFGQEGVAAAGYMRSGGRKRAAKREHRSDNVGSANGMTSDALEEGEGDALTGFRVRAKGREK